MYRKNQFLQYKNQTLGKKESKSYCTLIFIICEIQVFQISRYALKSREW